jgi:hypothetical protein
VICAGFWFWVFASAGAGVVGCWCRGDGVPVRYGTPTLCGGGTLCTHPAEPLRRLCVLLCTRFVILFCVFFGGQHLGLPVWCCVGVSGAAGVISRAGVVARAGVVYMYSCYLPHGMQLGPITMPLCSFAPCAQRIQFGKRIGDSHV